MMHARTALLVLALFLASSLPCFALGFGGGIDLTAEGLLATDAVHAGSTARAAVRFTIPEGWHIHSNKPLEPNLIPTAVNFEALPEGVTVEGMAFPEPELRKFGFSEMQLAVYEHTGSIGVMFNIADTVPQGPLTIKGSLYYQACNDLSCVAPASAPFELILPVVPNDQPLTEQHQDIFQGIDFASAESPTAMAAETEEATEVSPGDWQTAAEGFSVIGRQSGYMKAEPFIAWIDEAQAGTGGNNLNYFVDKSIVVVIILTLIGGLALNLTPCVLPLIPINLAIIGAGVKARSRARGFALGGVYGLGIALAYGIVGLVVVLTTGGFGAINAVWWFNAIIVVVFIVLGLAMFDVFFIDFSKYQAKLGLKKKEGGSFVLAFIMGGVAALLAGACVGPVVIAMVLYARDVYASGSVIGLALPFLLGVGMALPWPIVGGGIASLPKPGAWMTYVKYAFGVVIIAIALYFFGTKAWTGFRDQYLTDRSAVEAGVGEMDAHGWTPSLEQGLAMAKVENKPVIIDFWATWCTNCLWMNQTTFKDEAVVNRLEGFVKVKYQAQAPDESPHRDIMERFGVAGLGLPVYVILDPKTSENWKLSQNHDEDTKPQESYPGHG